MSNVATILARKGNPPIMIGSESTVLDALKIMSDKNVGAVVVKNGEKYEGIFTERDYSRNVILKGRHSYDTKVSDVMTVDLPSVGSLDTLEHCMELMSERNIKYLPVFEKGEMRDVISISDVIRETVIMQKETISHLKNYIQG